MDYNQIATGAVIVSEDSKKADPAVGITVLPTHLFITESSQVEVIVRVNGVEHVNFSDTVTPGPAGAASLYVRTLVRANIAAANIPPDPAVAMAARKAAKLPPLEGGPPNG